MAIQTYTEQEKLTAYNIYQWGVSGFTIENPNVETLQAFLDRHPEITNRTGMGVRIFMDEFIRTQSHNLEYFVGTPELFKIQQDYIIERDRKETILNKADKGQEIENAIELNELVKGFLSKKLRTYEGFMFNHLRHNNDSGYDAMSIKRNEIISKLNQVERFEADIAIATNSDPSHPISFLEETTFVEILKEISTGDHWRWTNITKILKVEEVYSAEAVKDEYIKLQQLVNQQLHNSNPIDPNIANGKDTLANELGGN